MFFMLTADNNYFPNCEMKRIEFTPKTHEKRADAEYVAGDGQRDIRISGFDTR